MSPLLFAVTVLAAAAWFGANMFFTARALFRAFALIAISTGTAFAAPHSDCQQRSLEALRTLAPDGFAIYSNLTDKKFFLSWISCDDLQLGPRSMNPSTI